MERVVGIRFRKGGKVYHFDAGELPLKREDFVAVHTEQGLGLGQVVEPPCFRNAAIHPAVLKKVERVATEEEIQKYRKNLEFESDAKSYCMERIRAHGLGMNLVDVEYFFDGSKIIFYFTADGRVDFRELLKDLVRRLRTRVELRQIGIRNQAKMVGGLGACGRPLCCATFLKNFHAVSIKMAKEQNLSLNPAKISGSCGRLMCCLQYEYETYRELKKDMPKLGKKIELPEGKGKVIRQNIIERTITVLLEDGKEIEKKLDPLPRGNERKKARE
ncbi:MAG: stage 0 sporulation family protein [Deltaproteobacteria bacterium]|nr:stage 0 sporulation family protein [Deltaproteobacteria bacterium]